MVNMLFSSYSFYQSWAKDMVSKYINSNDKVLIIPFSFSENICSDNDWQNAYSKNKGRFKS